MKVKAVPSLVALVTISFGLSFVLVACSSPRSSATAGAGTSPVAERGTVPNPGTGTTPAAAKASTSTSAVTEGEIKVTLEDRKFPKEIRVKAGTKVVFAIANRGSVEHTFELPDFGVKVKIKSEENGRLEWTVPDKKGKWDMGCFLTEEGFHEGMEGTLVIE